jgi:hypothetical protein
MTFERQGAPNPAFRRALSEARKQKLPAKKMVTSSGSPRSLTNRSCAQCATLHEAGSTGWCENSVCDFTSINIHMLEVESINYLNRLFKIQRLSSAGLIDAYKPPLTRTSWPDRREAAVRRVVDT